MDVKIEDSRKKVLHDEFSSSYFSIIKEQLLAEKQKYIVFPPSSLLFKAFDLTPFDDVKVVILWQDPYHGPGQAMWLSFSVPEGVKLPPSLKNIYAEVQSDLGVDMSKRNGDLTHWAMQWVLLLNAILTVRSGEPGSHKNIWREKFTDRVIDILSNKKENIVFMLWWNFAKAKSYLIDESKHMVLLASHPSPFSVHSWFFGCKHFSKANEYLRQRGLKEINWRE